MLNKQWVSKCRECLTCLTCSLRASSLVVRWKPITSWQSSSLAEQEGTSSGRHPSWSSRFTSAPRRSRHLAAERTYNITTTCYNARLLPGNGTYVQYYKQHATTYGYYLAAERTYNSYTQHATMQTPGNRTYVQHYNNTLQRTAITCSRRRRHLAAERTYNITNNTLQCTAITCST